MRTALFAVIVANIVCTFDALMFEDMLLSSMNNEDIFTNLSTAIVTYVKLKDIWSLKEPSYIHEFIGENTAFSNISLKMITTLLANGAKEGSTGNELMSFWNTIDKISLNDIYLSEFTFLNDIKNIELHLENAIYVQKSVDLGADFLSICINKLHCSISKVDFRNKVQAAEAINSWVQETTNNQILHVISPDNIDEDTKIMLINTVYLNIEWPNFRKGKTVDRIFHISPSEMYFVPTIKFKKTMFSYGEIPHWNCKFIEIPSLNDKITMIIFLPNEKMEIGNLEYLLEKFRFKEFQSVRTAYKLEQDMDLYLPKFTIQYTQNMTNFFHRMRVTTMFENNANFRRLSNIPLKVNDIVQKVFVKINEEDSTIPRVTFIRRRGKKSVGLPQELVVDRPFLYIIEINGKIEFIAAVRAPDYLFTRDEL